MKRLLVLMLALCVGCGAPQLKFSVGQKVVVTKGFHKGSTGYVIDYEFRGIRDVAYKISSDRDITSIPSAKWYWGSELELTEESAQPGKPEIDFDKEMEKLR